MTQLRSAQRNLANAKRPFNDQMAAFVGRLLLCGLNFFGTSSAFPAIESGHTGEATNDIDAIVMVHERATAERVLQGFTTHRLHGGEKGRGTYCGIHVDVYFEHQSTLGAASVLDVAKISRHRGEKLGNWVLLTPPAQFATKLAALIDRPGTAKGRRDANILYSMIDSGISPSQARSVFIESSGSADPQALWTQGRDSLMQVRSTSRERETLRGFFAT